MGAATKKSESGGAGTQVRIDADLAKMLRHLSADSGETVSAILSRMVREEVTKMYLDMVARLANGKR